MARKTKTKTKAKTKAKKKAGPPKITPRRRAQMQRRVAGRLSAAREASGLSQAAVARAVKMSPSLVSKIERGERGLDPLELGRFARLYGKSIVDFIGS